MTDHQRTLFDDAEPVVDHTCDVTVSLSRSTDPASSHAAAAQHVASGAHASQKQQVLAALRSWPGSTSKELAARAGLGRFVAARRLPDLEKAGEVRRERYADGRECRWWVKSGPGER